MARQAAAMPTLFKRSNHGSYCFRRVVGTKRTTINTGTSDYSEAKKFLRSYLQGENNNFYCVLKFYIKKYYDYISMLNVYGLVSLCFFSEAVCGIVMVTSRCCV